MLHFIEYCTVHTSEQDYFGFECINNVIYYKWYRACHEHLITIQQELATASVTQAHGATSLPAEF